MVDLLPVGDDHDAELRSIIERHLRWTDSAVAARLLDRWTDAVGEFRMVMPRDYARVVAVMKGAESEGLDEAATLERVMEASRG